MTESQLTPEQKKAIMKAMKSHMIANLLIFFKFLFFILMAAFVTAMVNFYYVKSESFGFMATLVNVIFLMHFMIQDMVAKRAVYDSAIKKILYPEGEKK